MTIYYSDRDLRMILERQEARAKKAIEAEEQKRARYAAVARQKCVPKKNKSAARHA